MLKRIYGIKIITLFGLLIMAGVVLMLGLHASNSYQQLIVDSNNRHSSRSIELSAERLIDQLFKIQLEQLAGLASDEELSILVQRESSRDLDLLLESKFASLSYDVAPSQHRSLTVRDVGGRLLAGAYQQEGLPYSGCPVLIDRIISSQDENLGAQSVVCTFERQAYAETLVSIGRDKTIGYLLISTHLPQYLQSLDDELIMPIRIYGTSLRKLYQSREWETIESKLNQLDDHVTEPARYVLYGDDNTVALNIHGLVDLSEEYQLINDELADVLIFMLLTTLVVVLMILLLLNVAFKPLDTIRSSVGALLTGSYARIDGKRLPYEMNELVKSYNELVNNLDEAASRQEEAEHELRRERDFISTTLDSITNAVLVLNSELEIKLANPAAETLLGDREVNLKGYALDRLVVLYTNRSVTHIADLPKLLKTPNQLINLFFQRDEKTIELEMTTSPMVDKESESVGHVVIFKDVTVDRKLRRKLNYEGRHDPLTGLLNRRAFESKFDSMVSDTDYTRNQHIMAMLDLDQFKVVNDTCGNAAGDALLKHVAGIIRQNIRKSDLLARLGADEFGVLLPYADPHAASNSINDIITYIAQEGFNWEGREFTITASAAMLPFGIAQDDYSHKFSMLNSACFLAKQNGGNQCYSIGEDDVQVKQHHSSMGWAADINKGLSEKRFKLYTQPIVPLTNLDDRKHCEVLIRYKDEDDTIIRPGEFLGPAERFNLVEKIDRWVISEVMRWLSEHNSKKGEVLFSINLSGRSLGSASFHNYVEQLLLTENIDASCLCFEITETAAIKDVEKSVKFIEMVKSHGGKFSLDDFGSGLSSFNYLKQFPVDYLKIDGAFIKDILVDAQSYAFVRSITEVGHCLGMKVIAEYVNSRMMLHMLREAKVDYLQGYSIGMPEPIENLDPA